jgi:hypothetical protein
VHVYVCILCVCLRRPKPFVCTHRERANNLRAEREKQSRLMNDPLLVGGCELYLSLYNIRSNMYPADQEKTFAIICLFVCVCVCVLRCCVLCLERVADAPSSSSPLFFSYSLIRGGSMRLILSFFSQCLSAFTAHRPRDRNIMYTRIPIPLYFFVFFVPICDG